MAACSIDLILNGEVVGTTSTHVGSARVVVGSNTTISVRTMIGTSTAATASLEMKRFTGGTSILTLTGSGTGLQDISGSAGSISGLSVVDDWYDFYLSGSASGVNSVIKGIRVVLQ
jgi:hypothetical protein